MDYIIEIGVPHLALVVHYLLNHAPAGIRVDEVTV